MVKKCCVRKLTLTIYFLGQDCTIGSSSGTVYEYAPMDFEVMDFGYQDDPSSILITLDDSLNDYFYVSGTKLLVSGSTNITRDVLFGSAAVTCSGVDGSNPVSGCIYAVENVILFHTIEQFMSRFIYCVIKEISFLLCSPAQTYPAFFSTSHSFCF